MGTPTPLEAAPAGLTDRDDVYLKREDVHELGAFKWRGALPTLERFRREGATRRRHRVHGQPRRSDRLGGRAPWPHGDGLRAGTASRTKLAHLTRLGGEVVQTGADLDEAKEQAVAYAAGMGLPFFEDGAEPAQLDGYAAIGEEISTSWTTRLPPWSCPSVTVRSSPAWVARSESVRRTRNGSASSRPAHPSWRSRGELDVPSTASSATRSPTGSPCVSRFQWPSSGCSRTRTACSKCQRPRSPEPSRRSMPLAYAPKQRPRLRSRRCPTSTPTARSCSSSPAATSTTSSSTAAAPQGERRLDLHPLSSFVRLRDRVAEHVRAMSVVERRKVRLRRHPARGDSRVDGAVKLAERRREAFRVAGR